ncbi:MAG: hypothetical protein ABIY51_12770 [Ferruginibacter sp.]
MIKLILILFMVVLVSSCATTSMTKYYTEHHEELEIIEQSYKENYTHKPFAIEFNDKGYKNIFLELLTDSIKYIYEFEVNEPRLQDTLKKFNLSPTPIKNLITRMQSIECKGVSMLDYYLGGKKNTLVFLSVKTKDFRWPLTPQKYYILTYYTQPQYYDAQGRLLDGQTRKRLRELNGDVFKRVNARVAYTISEHFR